MSGFAWCFVALALGQREPGVAEADKAAAAADAKPTAASTATPTEPVTSTAVHPERSASAEAEARSRRAPTSTPEPASVEAKPPRRKPAVAPSPPPDAGPSKAEPEREQALRAARAFLAALAASDAEGLAQAAADRFSFDGEALSGRDAIRRRWRELLAGRPGPAPRVNGVEVLSAQEATARWGKPPARVAALARPGVWVALGDVGGRPVVLFVARDGGRVAVLGIHD